MALLHNEITKIDLRANWKNGTADLLAGDTYPLLCPHSPDQAYRAPTTRQLSCWCGSYKNCAETVIQCTLFTNVVVALFIDDMPIFCLFSTVDARIDILTPNSAK